MPTVDIYARAQSNTSGPVEQMVDDGSSYRAFVGLFPPGKMFGRHEDQSPNLHGLARGLAMEGQRIRNRINALLAARDPRKAYAFLAEYEEMLGLPEADGAATTLTERLLACYERLTTPGDMSPDNLIAIGASLGYTIRIRFAKHNKWQLATGMLAKVSLSGGAVWDRLYIYVTGGANDPQLEAAINRMIPGHMVATFFYV